MLLKLRESIDLDGLRIPPGSTFTVSEEGIGKKLVASGLAVEVKETDARHCRIVKAPRNMAITGPPTRRSK